MCNPLGYMKYGKMLDLTEGAIQPPSDGDGL